MKTQPDAAEESPIAGKAPSRTRRERRSPAPLAPPFGIVAPVLSCAVDDTRSLAQRWSSKQVDMLHARRKSSSSVSAPPRLAVGIIFLAFAAVIATGAALRRYYARRSPISDRAVGDHDEIPAPELEPVR